ncbi:MAG: hypothetical protein JXQ29_15155 [Planctomycetes bacterium]|nr:hypothetical protein [Planctomycetota bacterium]
MPVRDLLAVLLRVVGLWYLIRYGAALPSLVAQGCWLFFSSQQRAMTEDFALFYGTVAQLLVPVLLFVLGLLLTLRAPRIALWFYPARDEAVPGEFRMRASGLLRAGIRVLGVYALFEAIGPLLRVLLRVLILKPHEEVTGIVISGEPFLENLASLTACLLAGLVLVLKAEAIAAWIERFGRVDPEQAAAAHPPIDAGRSGEASDS